LRKSAHLLLILSILILTLLPSGSGLASTLEQGGMEVVKARNLLEKMTPEERVGQLFLVSFQGATADRNSQIYDLITNYHIGGVVLRAENNNFIGPENTPAAAQELIINLQTAGWDAATAASTDPSAAGFIPLLIGISQEGDQYPYNQILNGLTELPDQMAVGATWNPEYAKIIGSIQGSELKAIGINLLFGPSLDVLDSVQTYSGDDLGVRTFGGDPFWVGEMGKAYVQGVHEGSRNKIAVVATHFPGRGESDRQPDEEIATVRKSLEQLKQVELAPFFSVTGKAEEQSQIVDGLLLSHIRYQGFQGNIRATTKPVSFDAAALDLIMKLPEFTDWRSMGGLIVSEDLGTEAVRKFFDPLSTGFDARQVARSALLAGNDLLNLGNILATNDPDSYTTVVRIIEYFNQRYLDDPTFQARVDKAVKNILIMKFKIYPAFQLEDILPNSESLDSLGQSQAAVSMVAQKAATLVNPSLSDIDVVLPNPPQFADRIVFISDSMIFRQCSTCGDQTSFPAGELMNAVTRLYGPSAGDQIQASRMHAYSFDNLRVLLEKGTGVESVQTDLGSADWIIFIFTESGKRQYEKEIYQRMFTERPDLTRNKKIIGFSMNAPYYFDATDISKFTAYYALFSKINAFYDVAARILFQELLPDGNLPVSVPGVGYDLITATSPDPDQIIPLSVGVTNAVETVIGTPVSDSSKPLHYTAGDTIPIQTGVILDHNGNPVPDGTIVRFLIDSRSANGTLEQIEAQTADGIASTTYIIPSIGSLELRVEADPALTSQILRLDITNAGGVVTSFEPTVSSEENQEVEPTAVPTPTQANLSTIKHEQGKLSIVDWLVSSILIFACCLTFNWLARRTLSLKWNILTTISIALGGNLAYMYLAAGLPGSASFVQKGGTAVTILIVVLGMAGGLGTGLLLFFVNRRKKKTNAKP